MSVGKYCRRNPVTASPGDTVRDAAIRMDSLGVGSVVVVDESERPVGMVTDRDLALRVLRGRLDAGATALSEVMHEGVVTVTEKASLPVAIRFMSREGVRRIPVVDAESGRLTGILTCDDVLPLIADELSAAAGVVRSQPSALAKE